MPSPSLQSDVDIDSPDFLKDVSIPQEPKLEAQAPKAAPQDEAIPDDTSAGVPLKAEEQASPQETQETPPPSAEPPIHEPPPIQMPDMQKLQAEEQNKFAAQKEKEPLKPDLPETKPVELPFKELMQPEKAPQPTAWDMLNQAVGTDIYRNIYRFGQGLPAGAAKIGDMAVGALQAPFRLAGYVASGPQGANKAPEDAYTQNYNKLLNASFPNWQSQYEKSVGEETAKSPAFQAGKAVGEMGLYALQPEAGVAKVFPMLFRTAEGAGLGLSESAQRQIREKGNIDPLELAGDTAFNAALGAGGGYFSKKFLRKGKPPSKEGEATPPKGEPPQPPGGPGTPPAGPPNKQEGIFRYLSGGVKGFDIAEYGKELHELQEALTPAEFAQLKKAVAKIGGALAVMKHTANELDQAARNALKLAATQSQRNAIETKVESEFTSAGRAIRDKAHTELYEKQAAAKKEGLEARKGQIEQAMTKASDAVKGDLQKELAMIENVLRQLHYPKELFDIPETKHLYAMLNREDIYSPKVTEPKLAKTYPAAIAQVEELGRDLKAAEKQFEKAKEQELDLFANIEKKVQSFFAQPGNVPERLAIRVPILNKHDVSKTGVGFISLVHDSTDHHLFNLQGIFKKELVALEAELKKMPEYWRTESTFTGNVGKYERVNPVERLQKKGDLVPGIFEHAGKAMLIAGLGIQAADTPVHAADGENEDATKHNLGLQVMAAGAVALAIGHGGGKFIRQMIRDPNYWFMRAYANTNDLVKVADLHLNLSDAMSETEAILSEKGQEASLAWRMNAVRGKAIMAQIMTPDDSQAVANAIFKRGPVDTLSPQAQQMVGEVHEMARDLARYAKDYRHKWEAHVSAYPEEFQNRMKPVTAAVKFVDATLNNVKHDSLIDHTAAKIMGNAAQAWFRFNPQTWLAQTMDFALSGPLALGDSASVAGARAYMGKAEIRQSIDKMFLAGARSEQLTDMAGKAMQLPIEHKNAGMVAASSAIDYFRKNKIAMKIEGVKTEEEFVHKLYNGQISADNTMGAAVKLGVDLAETLGADSLRLIAGPFQRSGVGSWLRFLSQLERYPRQMFIAGMRKDCKSIAMSSFFLHQFGGQAVVPKSLQLIGWAAAPAATAQMIYFLNAASMGQRLFGDLSGKVDWDPILYPLLGVNAPGFANIQEAIGNLPAHMREMGAVAYAIMNEPERLTGDKFVEANEEAQKGLRNVLNDMSYIWPSIAGVPLQRLSAFTYNMPGVLHNQYVMSVPRPGLGQLHPLMSGQVMTYPGAATDSLRAAFSMKPGFGTTTYKTMHQGRKMGEKTLTEKDAEALNKIQSRETAISEE